MRGRRRGAVRCIFHRDERPSLSVDLDRGVFHCFGCPAQGGVRRFAELVGEAVPRRKRSAPRSDLAEARAAVLREARRQPWARPGVLEMYADADLLRALYQLKVRLEQRATAKGSCDQGWEELTEAAAAAERTALNLEADLEDQA